MLNRTRKGFTLLELIVVIVILGILAAIAIPTFKAVIDKAKYASLEETAQASANNVVALAAFDRPENFGTGVGLEAFKMGATNAAMGAAGHAQGELPVGFRSEVALNDGSGVKFLVTKSGTVFNDPEGVYACVTIKAGANAGKVSNSALSGSTGLAMLTGSYLTAAKVACQSVAY